MKSNSQELCMFLTHICAVRSVTAYRKLNEGRLEDIVGTWDLTKICCENQVSDRMRDLTALRKAGLAKI